MVRTIAQLRVRFVWEREDAIPVQLAAPSSAARDMGDRGDACMATTSASRHVAVAGSTPLKGEIGALLP